MYLSSFYQQKTIKNFQNVLTKDLKDVDIGMNIKQKLEKKKKKKKRQMCIDIFLNQNFCELTDCLF